MALLPAPMFWGLITITASSNDRIDFTETDGVTPTALNTTITAGTYYPDAAVAGESLATQIGNALTSASTYGATYTVSVDATNGNVEIAASGGTLTGFYLMLTTSESNKLLTGGDQSADEQGLEHFGFTVDSGYPAEDLTASGDTQVSNAWHPQGPVAGQTTIAGLDYSYSTQVVATTTLGHKTTTRDFSPRVASTSPDYSEVIRLEFQYLSDSDRTNYREFFWSCYAKTGDKFRYFPDRSDLTDYTEVHLKLESANSFAPSRLRGYPHFNNTLQLKRWK